MDDPVNAKGLASKWLWGCGLEPDEFISSLTSTIHEACGRATAAEAARVERLRKVLIDTVHALGSRCADWVSDDFLSDVSTEAMLVRKALVARIAKLEAVVDAAKDLRPFHCWTTEQFPEHNEDCDCERWERLKNALMALDERGGGT